MIAKFVTAICHSNICEIYLQNTLNINNKTSISCDNSYVTKIVSCDLNTPDDLSVLIFRQLFQHEAGKSVIRVEWPVVSANLRYVPHLVRFLFCRNKLYPPFVFRKFFGDAVQFPCYLCSLHHVDGEDAIHPGCAL